MMIEYMYIGSPRACVVMQHTGTGPRDATSVSVSVRTPVHRRVRLQQLIYAHAPRTRRRRILIIAHCCVLCNNVWSLSYVYYA